MKKPTNVAIALIAWILWEEVSGPNNYHTLKPLSGFHTRLECFKALLEHTEVMGGSIEPDGRGAARTGFKMDYLAEFACLPDTVNPENWQNPKMQKGK